MPGKYDHPEKVLFGVNSKNINKESGEVSAMAKTETPELLRASMRKGKMDQRCLAEKGGSYGRVLRAPQCSLTEEQLWRRMKTKLQSTFLPGA